MTLLRTIVAAVWLGRRRWRRAAARADPTDDDPDAAALDPDYAAGKKAIEAKDWRAAVKALSSAALRDTRNADIQNYLGYAYRHLGDMPRAFAHYERALKLNPRHRGAHEYAGRGGAAGRRPAARATAPGGAEGHLRVALRGVRRSEGGGRGLSARENALRKADWRLLEQLKREMKT